MFYQRLLTALLLIASITLKAQKNFTYTPEKPKPDDRAFGVLDIGLHRVGVFGAEIEDLAHFDPAPDLAPIFGDGVPHVGFVGLVGAGI